MFKLIGQQNKCIHQACIQMQATECTFYLPLLSFSVPYYGMSAQELALPTRKSLRAAQEFPLKALPRAVIPMTQFYFNTGYHLS